MKWIQGAGWLLFFGTVAGTWQLSHRGHFFWESVPLVAMTDVCSAMLLVLLLAASRSDDSVVGSPPVRWTIRRNWPIPLIAMMGLAVAYCAGIASAGGMHPQPSPAPTTASAR